jgi:hypothetical protein
LRGRNISTCPGANGEAHSNCTGEVKCRVTATASLGFGFREKYNMAFMAVISGLNLVWTGIFTVGSKSKLAWKKAPRSAIP